MTPLSQLLERVERAEGPDREIDLDIGLTLAGWKRLEPDARGDEWLKADDGYYPWPPSPGQGWPSFTESLDAAMALVHRTAPVWAVEVTQYSHTGLCRARLWRNYDGHREHVSDREATPALALLAALLKSLLSEETDHA